MKISTTAKTKLELIKAAIERGTKIFDHNDLFVCPIITVTDQDNNDLDEGLWDPCLEVKDDTLLLIGNEGCSGYGYTATITMSLEDFEIISIECADNKTPRTSYSSADDFIKDVKECYLENIDACFTSDLEDLHEKLSAEDKELLDKLCN